MKSSPFIGLILGWFSVSAAHADLCADIQSFVTSGAALVATLPEAGKATSCRHSLMTSGHTQVHCRWTFPYRAPAATAAFEDLLAETRACAEGIQAEQDTGVNHPDSYALQIFQHPSHEIGVSLKDKAALGETYVFLRVSPLN